MKILVVAATLPEISGIHDHFDLPRRNFIQSPAFDILVTGVGMTATAYALGKYLSASYQLVLNLGIAGAFDRSLSLGEVVNVTSDGFPELGAEDKTNFLTIEELGFGKSSYSNSPLPFSQLETLRSVNGITVNTVHGNQDSIDRLSKRLQPDVESMEGAALFYACEQSGHHCVQVRSISNYVEERNRSNWNIGLAVKNLNKWGIDFLTNI